MTKLSEMIKKLPIDKVQHLGMGLATIVAVLLINYVYQHYGWGPALALSTTLMGLGYEAQQWYRKEGEPSLKDAAATALPGVIALLFDLSTRA